MIDKIAALYKQGRLSGDEFNGMLKEIAAKQMEKKAGIMDSLRNFRNRNFGDPAKEQELIDKSIAKHKIWKQSNPGASSKESDGKFAEIMAELQGTIKDYYGPEKTAGLGTAAKIVGGAGLASALLALKGGRSEVEKRVRERRNSHEKTAGWFSGAGKKEVKSIIEQAVQAGLKAGEGAFTAIRKDALAPTKEAVEAIVKRIKTAVTDDEVMNLVAKIDFSTGTPMLAATRAGGKYMQNAEAVVRGAATKRIGELSAPAASMGERFSRMNANLGTAPTLGILGTAGIGLAKGFQAISSMFEERKQNNVIKSIITDNKDIDPVKAVDNFRSLQRVAPDIAGDKAIASGFIKRMNEFETLDLAPLEAVSKIQEGLTKKNYPKDGITKFDDSIKSLAGALALGV